MNASPPRPESTPSSRSVADDLQVRNWLRLQREFAELHARLEYLKLMLSLGASR